MSMFKGSGVALVTPFKDGRIDYTALEGLIEWHIGAGTDALIVCGTTGEASTLSPVEKLSLVEFTIKKTDGRIPVIAGSGSNDTSHSMYLSKEMEYAGADGLLIVTPYYNKATQSGLIQHYHAIADYVEIPIILYSVKSRTGLNIDPSTVKELKNHPNICGIKEASGDFSQICSIAALADSDFVLYSGNDDHTIAMMALGAVGCISTVANIIPAQYHQMTKDYLDGRHKTATKKQLAMLPLIHAIFAEVNPIPVKAALNMMGKHAGPLRLPLTEMSEKNKAVLKATMEEVGLI